jgi:hypothetical protein
VTWTTKYPAGDKLMSKVVNWMIHTKPVFGVMKLGAKAVMKRTSRKAGVDWDAHARQMQQTAEVRQRCWVFEFTCRTG